MRSGLAWGFFVFLMGVLAFIFWPVHPGHGPNGKSTACLSNLKSIGLGHIMYATDNDERFSQADWVPALKPYVKYPAVFRCPAVPEGESGYAYNRFLVGRKLVEMDQPEKIALSFEVDNLPVGATAERLMPLESKRHEDKLALAFADGHAKRLPFDRLGTVWMEPKASTSSK